MRPKLELLMAASIDDVEILVISPANNHNENMLSLQEELTSTENKVTFSRQGYNDSVTAYNNQREVFPAVLFANSLGFHMAELWELDEKEAEAARARPQVDFS